MSRFGGQIKAGLNEPSQEPEQQGQHLRMVGPASEAAGATLDAEGLLRAALERIVEVTGASSGVVYVRREANSWELTATHNVPEEMKASHHRITDDYPGLRSVLESSGPVAFSEWTNEPSQYISTHNKQSGMQSWAAVAISVQGELFAVLGISSTEYDAFSSEHVNVMGIIGQLLSLALSNTVAHEQAFTRVDAQLRERVIEMESVLASMSDGLLICDQGGRIVRANAAAAQITRTPIGQLIGKSVLSEEWNRAPDGMEQYGPGDGPLVRAFRGGEAANKNFRIRMGAHGEESILSVSISPLYGDSRDSGETSGAVIVMRDITEEWQAEQSKEEFLGILSHELRSPLTVISGYAQFLGRKLAKQGLDEDVQSADLIREHALRMASMIGDLVESGRLESGMQAIEKEPADVGALMQNVIWRINTEQRYGKKEARHTITAAIEPELPNVMIDKGRIDQVLTNLLTNAVKYGPEGGEITVSAKIVGEQDPADGETAGASRLLISVTDQGVGVPVEEREHIFERGFRGERGKSVSAQGLGLGLYICRLAVEAHGGRIGVKDGPGGVGSTFWFTLPLE